MVIARLDKGSWFDSIAPTGLRDQGCGVPRTASAAGGLVLGYFPWLPTGAGNSSAQPGQRFGGAQLALEVAFEDVEGEAAEILGAAAGKLLVCECGGRGAEHAQGELPRVG